MFDHCERVMMALSLVLTTLSRATLNEVRNLVSSDDDPPYGTLAPQPVRIRHTPVHPRSDQNSSSR